MCAWSSFVTILPPSAHQLTSFFNLTSSFHTDEEKKKKRRRSEKQRWGGKQNRQRKSREEVGSTVSALTRLRRRKWRQLELGHEWDEIRGGDTGALQATTSNVWPKIGPPGRRASNLWILCSSTAEGWEGSTFLVARDVCALRKGAPLQHAQCYIIPDALQGRSSKVPLPSHVHPLSITYSAAVPCQHLLNEYLTIC